MLERFDALPSIHANDTVADLNDPRPCQPSRRVGCVMVSNRWAGGSRIHRNACLASLSLLFSWISTRKWPTRESTHPHPTIVQPAPIWPLNLFKPAPTASG